MVKMITTWPLVDFQRLTLQNSQDITDHKKIFGHRFGQEGWYQLLNNGQELQDFEVEEVGGEIQTIFVPWIVNVLTTRPSTPQPICDILDSHCYRGGLKSNVSKYNYFLPKTFYEAFDYDNSWYDRMPDRTGNDIPDSTITNIRTFVLYANKIGDAPLFRIMGRPDEIGVRQKIFCSEEFFELSQSYDAQGIVFTDVKLN